MEAILATAHNRQLEIAATHWLLASRRLARAALRAAGDVMVRYSRAGLMVQAGSRRLRRF